MSRLLSRSGPCVLLLGLGGVRAGVAQQSDAAMRHDLLSAAVRQVDASHGPKKKSDLDSAALAHMDADDSLLKYIPESVRAFVAPRTLLDAWRRMTREAEIVTATGTPVAIPFPRDKATMSNAIEELVRFDAKVINSWGSQKKLLSVALNASGESFGLAGDRATMVSEFLHVTPAPQPRFLGVPEPTGASPPRVAIVTAPPMAPGVEPYDVTITQQARFVDRLVDSLTPSRTRRSVQLAADTLRLWEVRRSTSPWLSSAVVMLSRRVGKGGARFYATLSVSPVTPDTARILVAYNAGAVALARRDAILDGLKEIICNVGSCPGRR